MSWPPAFCTEFRFGLLTAAVVIVAGCSEQPSTHDKESPPDLPVAEALPRDDEESPERLTQSITGLSYHSPGQRSQFSKVASEADAVAQSLRNEKRRESELLKRVRSLSALGDGIHGDPKTKNRKLLSPPGYPLPARLEDQSSLRRS